MLFIDGVPLVTVGVDVFQNPVHVPVILQDPTQFGGMNAVFLRMVKGFLVKNKIDTPSAVIRNHTHENDPEPGDLANSQQQAQPIEGHQPSTERLKGLVDVGKGQTESHRTPLMLCNEDQIFLKKRPDPFEILLDLLDRKGDESPVPGPCLIENGSNKFGIPV